MADRQSRRVLLVDDDEVLLAALRRALTDAGFEVVAHHTFDHARRAIQTQTFDAMLIDIRLGAFNGLHLAILGRESQPHVHIVVFSGFDDLVLRAEAAAIGADYVTKPAPATQLIALLNKRQRM